MEIRRQQQDDILELKIKGRLDGYWADHLTKEIADVLRDGARCLRLDLGDVTYMSSAGIRVLMQTYKQLRGIQGSFVISNPSDQVKTILELAGFSRMLGFTEAAPLPATPAEARPVRVLERAHATFEIFDSAPGSSLTCRAIGQPELLNGCQFREEHGHTILCPDSMLAIGLGAFGRDFADCQERFGEFLSVAGAAAYLPTDGSNAPDYMLATGNYVPNIKVCYALTGEGAFAHAAQFERRLGSEALTLSEIVDVGFEMAGTDVIGMAMVAESAGLMGAALRRSPAEASSGIAPFDFPEVRQWLSFTAERAYTRSLALVVGIAAKVEHPALAPFIRPLGQGAWPAGHFHAAAFSYRPMKKGEVELKSTVGTLFEAETLQGLVHLLNDNRENDGAGQSEFLSGACWIGPVSDIIVEP